MSQLYIHSCINDLNIRRQRFYFVQPYTFKWNADAEIYFRAGKIYHLFGSWLIGCRALITCTFTSLPPTFSTKYFCGNMLTKISIGTVVFPWANWKLSKTKKTIPLVTNFFTIIPVISAQERLVAALRTLPLNFDHLGCGVKP